MVRPPMPMLFNGQAPPRASFDGRMGNVGEKPDIGCLGSNAHTGIYMKCGSGYGRLLSRFQGVGKLGVAIPLWRCLI
jgi:hypothetical protein